MTSVFSLFDASLQMHDYPAAREMTERIVQREGYSASWCSMVEKYADSLSDGQIALVQLQSACQKDLNAMNPRFVLAKKLLNLGRAPEAVPYLQELQQHGHPEGAFFLGTLAEMQGNYKAAFYWMGRANELNPGHEETAKHLAMIRECMEEANA